MVFFELLAFGLGDTSFGGLDLVFFFCGIGFARTHTLYDGMVTFLPAIIAALSLQALAFREYLLSL